jgi:KDO2-lipid IV(A) lauroyltransferase
MKGSRGRHSVEFALYRVLRSAIAGLPRCAVRPLGAALGRLGHAIDKRHRDVARRNLALAYPHWPDTQVARLTRACFTHFGGALSDALRLLQLDAVELCERVRIEGWEHLDRAQAANRGCFLMGAHLGYWEVIAPVVSLYRPPFHVVGRPPDNPYLDAELRRLRSRFGSRLIDKRGAARGILRALEERSTVGILIDQRVHPREGIQVPFFGQAAWTTPVLARFSLRSGAPVVPVYAWPQPGGRYRMAFREPIWPESRASADAGGAADAATIADLTARYLAEVEGEIRRAPELWLWLHDRWKDPTPPRIDPSRAPDGTLS